MNDKTQDRGAIGGTSSLGSAQQVGNITYGAMPEQLAKQLQGDHKGEFILLRKTYQSEPAQVWATGDPEQVRALFRESYEQLAHEPA